MLARRGRLGVEERVHRIRAFFWAAGTTLSPAQNKKTKEGKQLPSSDISARGIHTFRRANAFPSFPPPWTTCHTKPSLAAVGLSAGYADVCIAPFDLARLCAAPNGAPLAKRDAALRATAPRAAMPGLRRPADCKHACEEPQLHQLGQLVGVGCLPAERGVAAHLRLPAELLQSRARLRRRRLLRAHTASAAAAATCAAVFSEPPPRGQRLPVVPRPAVGRVTAARSELRRADEQHAMVDEPALPPQPDVA